MCRSRYADKASMELGLLFTCRLGNVDLDRPVGACHPASHLPVSQTLGVLRSMDTSAASCGGPDGGLGAVACRAAPKEVPGRAADDDGGDADGAADALPARAGAGGGGQRAARPRGVAVKGLQHGLACLCPNCAQAAACAGGR